MKLALLPATIALAVVLAACSSDDAPDASVTPGAGPAGGSTTAVAGEQSPDGPGGAVLTTSGPATGAGGAVAQGPGISVTEALASTLRGQLLVDGFLIIDGERVLFCETLAESMPPQCGGAQLGVDGLDRDAVEGLRFQGSRGWTGARIQLLGTVDGGVLTLGGNALAAGN